VEFTKGHYVSHSKHGNSWYTHDDRKVIPISESEVLGSQAYMIFYTKLTEEAKAIRIQKLIDRAAKIGEETGERQKKEAEAEAEAKAKRKRQKEAEAGAEAKKKRLLKKQRQKEKQRGRDLQQVQLQKQR
jgi:Rps23 Pro-64 3,4-dihydroxylase Tpa1-like proline 4-hydroxylase